MVLLRDSAVMIVLLFGGVFELLSAQQSSEIIFDLDTLLSQATQDEIKTWFERSYREDGDCQTLFGNLKAHIPAIASFVCRTIRPGVIFVRVTCAAPILSVNNSLILADGGQVFDRSILDQSQINDLLNVNVAMSGAQQVDTDFKNFVSALTPELCMRFHITWKDKTTVVLRNKTDETCVLVCDSTHIPTADTIELCQRLIQQKSDTTSMGCTKTPRMVIADMRFDRQIVMKIDEGECHGKNRKGTNSRFN